MSYDELISDAMSIHKIPGDRKESAKASILKSAFRLRTVRKNHHCRPSREKGQNGNSHQMVG